MSTTITGSPSSFDLPITNTSRMTVTFAIPSGTWTSGTWAQTATWTGFGQYSGDVETSPSGSTSVSGLGHHVNPGGVFNDSSAASTTQMTDINAAAGGTLTTTVINVSANGAGDINVSNITLTLVPASTPVTTTPRNLGIFGDEWLPEGEIHSLPLVRRIAFTLRRGGLVVAEELLPEAEIYQHPLVRWFNPGQAFASLVGSLPFAENCSVQQFVQVTYPGGYKRATLDASLGSSFDSARPRSNLLAVIRHNVLILTDSTGAELTTGTACGPVDIWRFRYG